MNNKPKFSINPPTKKQVPPVEDFILGANKLPTDDSNTTYPWQEDWVRGDVDHRFILRFKEPLFLQLKYIHTMTRYSMHEICMDILRKGIEEELRKLTGK